MKTVWFTFISLIFGSMLFSQQPKKLVREGNRLYEKGNYSDAEVQYKKALTKDSIYTKARYNLGNAFYKENNYEDAMNTYQKVINDPKTSKELKAKILHNIGNIHLQNKKLEESIESYKQSLRLNPNDSDTKYNLAYAMKLLQKEKNQKNDKKNDNKNKNDQQNKDKDNNQQNKPQNNQNKPDNQQNKAQQQNQKKLKREEAERMLEALRNDEKKTLNKLKKQKVYGTKQRIEKDW